MTPTKVLQKTALTPEIILLKLEPESSFNYQAGDYLTLGFEPGDEEAVKDFHRFKPFSIANAPKDNTPIELHIRLNQNTDADQVWIDKIKALQLGDKVWINGPFQQFRLEKNLEHPIILVAGGTGFAPMKSLLEQLLEQNFTQPIDLYWGAKTESELYLKDWISNLAAQTPNLSYHPILSEQKHPDYRQGWVHQAVLQDFPDLSDKIVYVCGPWPMQQAAKADFLQANLKETHFN